MTGYAKRYEVAARSLVGSIQTWFAFPQFFQHKEPVNQPTRRSRPRAAWRHSGRRSGTTRWPRTRPSSSRCPSAPTAPTRASRSARTGTPRPDYETHQTSLTKAQAVTDPDGKMRFVISETPPGGTPIANWLETTGHRTGALMLRWQRLTRDLGPEDGPVAEVMPLADVPLGPALHPSHHRGVRRADRRPAALRCPKDDQLIDQLGYAEAHDTSIEERYTAVPLLKGKVIVISGIGPGLGRSLAEEAAKMGADLVIASRTESRLLALQAELEGHGVKVVSVVTDVTDEDSRVNLRDKTLEAFGRVDCVINNAFTIPPMDPITQISPRKLAKVNETNVFAPLRLSALYADALAEAKGSIIMLNSCVSFSSQPEYAGYKLSKGALEHLASSLATELGPRGIRVNSVAPSYIYEDVNRGYFDFLGAVESKTHEEVYAEKAAPTDLKRLASSEEVARATLFLASDLASAVTGQMLTVDCGEFHS